MKRFDQYIHQVKSGEVLTNKWVKLAIQRHMKDLQNPAFFFDREAAQKVISFIEALKHIKGDLAGKPILLDPWQVFFIGSLYGWKRKDTGRRRFKKAFLFIARKNGKTLLGSALQVHDVLTEPGAEVYSIATTKDQANLSFKNCRAFVKKNEDLSRLLSLFQYEVRNENQDGVIKALSSEHDTHDGLNVSFCLADEVAAHKDYQAVNVIRSGMKSRSQPLLLMITTAGYSVAEDNPGHGEFSLSKKLLSGLYQDETYFTLLYCLDDGDDWKDPRNYIKANPGLGSSITLETLKEELGEAIEKPSYKPEFYTKTLNWFLQKEETGQWFPVDVIERMKQKQPPEDFLKGLPVVGAIDLSKRIDFTAYTLTWWDQGAGLYYRKHKFYIPEKQIETKFQRDSSMLYHWIEKGWIKPTPGEVIDYEFLIDDINRDRAKYQLLTDLVYDRWSSTDVVKELQSGANMIEMDMSTKSMSEPAKAYEADVLQGIIVDNNPVSHWMHSCAKVFSMYNNNIRIEKIDSRKDSRRIDAVITSIMGHAHLKATAQKPPAPDYEWGDLEY